MVLAPPEATAACPESRKRTVVDDVGSDEEKIVGQPDGGRRPREAAVARASDGGILKFGVDSLRGVGIDRHIAAIAREDRLPAVRPARGRTERRAVVLSAAEPRAAVRRGRAGVKLRSGEAVVERLVADE